MLYNSTTAVNLLVIKKIPRKLFFQTNFCKILYSVCITHIVDILNLPVNFFYRKNYDVTKLIFMAYQYIIMINSIYF